MLLGQGGINAGDDYTGEKLMEKKIDRRIEGRLRVRKREDRSFPFTLQFLPYSGPGGAWPEKKFPSEKSLFVFLKNPPLNLNLNDWIHIQGNTGRMGDFRIVSSHHFEIYYEGENHQNIDSIGFWNLMENDFYIPSLAIPIDWGKATDLLPDSFSL